MAEAAMMALAMSPLILLSLQSVLTSMESMMTGAGGAALVRAPVASAPAVVGQTHHSIVRLAWHRSLDTFQSVLYKKMWSDGRVSMLRISLNQLVTKRLVVTIL